MEKRMRIRDQQEMLEARSDERLRKKQEIYRLPEVERELERVRREQSMRRFGMGGTKKEDKETTFKRMEDERLERKAAVRKALNKSY